MGPSGLSINAPAGVSGILRRMETTTAPNYQTGTRLLDLRRGLPGIVVRVTGPDAQGYPVRLDVIWSDASMHHNIPAAVAASWSIRPDTADADADNARFPAWAEEDRAAMETSLGDAYSEPAADVRGYIDYVRSQSG